MGSNGAEHDGPLIILDKTDPNKRLGPVTQVVSHRICVREKIPKKPLSVVTPPSEK